MKKFFYSTVCLFLIFLNVLLIYSFPFGKVLQLLGPVRLLIFASGVLAYTTIHILRKPTTLYVWNHEMAHLLVAKLFLKRMSSFQISVKRGGKVVLSESNFVIDLAPYIFTPAGLGIVFLSILMEKGGYRYADTGGIFLLGMNLGMIVCFDYEAFASGQEDIKRNGYFFSFLFVLLFLLLTLPVSLLPGFASPWESGKSLYRSWGIGCLNTLKTVKFHIVPFIRLIASRFH